MSLEEHTNKKLRVELKEAQEQANVSNTNNLLDLIYDEDAQERYAPDLVFAIKAWEHIYINCPNPNDNSHGNKINIWLEKNTPYKNKSEIPMKRIREVTSPFTFWQQDRKIKLVK